MTLTSGVLELWVASLCLGEILHETSDDFTEWRTGAVKSIFLKEKIHVKST